VGRIHIPHRHNTGFHGNWIPDSELEQVNGVPMGGLASKPPPFGTRF